MGWVANVAQGIASWLGTTGVTQTIVKLGISYTLTSFVARQAVRGSGGDFADEVARRLTTVRASAEPRRIVYGKTRLGGVLTYTETHGDDNKFLNAVITLTGHEVDAIESVLWGDTTLTFTGDDGDVTNSNLQHPDAGAGSLLFVSKNLGTDAQTADADLTGLGLTWGSTHRQRGCANLYLRMHGEQERLADFENVTAIVRGKKVYDPRTATTVYSNNAALCTADYLMDTRYGYGIPLAKIDSASLIAAANVCDELVTTAAAGTEKRYTVNGSFNSAAHRGKVLTDLKNAMAGSVVWSSGKYYINAGAYAGPAFTLTDDHLRGGLNVKTLDSVSEVTNRVRGIYANPSANYQIDDFPPVVNATYLSEDNGEEFWRDIELPFTTSPGVAQRLAKIDLERSRQEITVQFPAMAHALQLKAGDTVAVTNSRMGWSSKVFDVQEVSLVEDGGYLGADLRLKETASTVYDWNSGEETEVDPAPNTNLPDPSTVAAPTSLAVTSGTAELIAKADGSIISRAKLAWTRPVGEFAQRIQPEYKKQIETTGSITALDNTLVVTNGRFDASMVGKEIIVAEAATGPANLVTTIASVTDADTVELTDAADLTVVDKSVSGDAFWIQLPQIPVSQTSYWIADVVDGVAYDFRVAALNGLAVKSSYITVTNHTIVGKTAAPGVPTGFSVQASVESILVEWTNVADVDLDTVQIQWDTVNTFDSQPFSFGVAAQYGEVGSYTIRKYKVAGVLEKLPAGQTLYVRILSVDTTGNISAYTTELSATTRATNIDVPDFTYYGSVGGTDDFVYTVNQIYNGNASDGSIRIQGNRLIRVDGTEQKLFGPTDARTDYTGTTTGVFFLCMLKSSADSLWPLGNWGGGASGEIFVVAVRPDITTSGNLTWVAIDDDNAEYTLAPGGGISLIAKVEKYSETGGVDSIVPLTSGLQKPAELELEFASVAAMKAHDFTATPNLAAVRIKDHEVKGYWDPDSVATADNFSVFAPDTPPGGTGRVCKSFIGQVQVTEAGALIDDSTDDGPAIQAICDYFAAHASIGAGIVNFPGGKMKVDTPVRIDTPMTFRGVNGFPQATTEGTYIYTDTDSIDMFTVTTPRPVFVDGIDFQSTATTQGDGWLFGRADLTVSDAAITASDNTLTSASNPWNQNDVGKAITVVGAGVAAADLVTTIASFTDAGEVELTDAASSTVSGADATRDAYSNKRSRFLNCGFVGFDTQVKMIACGGMKIDKCAFISPVDICIDIDQAESNDQGDNVITNSVFDESTGARYAIRNTRSGGTRVMNNKFLHFDVHFRLQVSNTSGTNTSIIMFEGNSCEIYSQAAFRVTDASGGFGRWDYMNFVGNNFTSNSGTYAFLIETDRSAFAVIAANQFHGSGHASGTISLNGAAGWLIDGNQFTNCTKAIKLDEDTVDCKITESNQFYNCTVDIDDDSDSGGATGTAQAGAASTITLAAGDTEADDFYNDRTVTITAGTGAGQSRVCTDFVNSTKVATITPNWTTNPDATSVYAWSKPPSNDIPRRDMKRTLEMEWLSAPAGAVFDLCHMSGFGTYDGARIRVTSYGLQQGVGIGLATTEYMISRNSSTWKLLSLNGDRNATTARVHHSISEDNNVITIRFHAHATSGGTDVYSLVEFVCNDSVVIEKAQPVDISADVSIDDDDSSCGNLDKFYPLVAGETLANKDTTYLKSDGKMWKTDADAESTCGGLVALCIEPMVADEKAQFMMEGIHPYSGLAAGTTYYFSTTAGGIQSTKPSGSGDVQRVAGYGMGSAELYFKPSDHWEVVP